MADETTDTPSFLSRLFTKNNIISGLKGLNKLPTGGTSGLPTGIGKDLNDGMTEAERTNAQIGNGVQTALSGLLDFNTINSSGMNGLQKTMARGDAGVNAVSDLASNIPGIGGAIGGSLKTINQLGGMLVSTPKEVKDYVGNAQVLSSSAYTGVAAQAGDTQNSINTFKSSGLFGKLLGKGGVKSSVNNSNSMQKQVQGVLDTSNNIKTRSAGSSDMFASNNVNNISGMNSMWTNGSIQYGQQGVKLLNGVMRNPKTNPTSAEKYKTNAQGKTEVDAMDEVLSAPQKSAVWMTGNGYKKPSEAMNIQNPYGAMATDLVLDPMNLFAVKGVTKWSELAEKLKAAKASNLVGRIELGAHPKTIMRAAGEQHAAVGGLMADKGFDAMGGVPSKRTGGRVDYKKIVRDVAYIRKKQAKPINPIQDVEDEPVASFKEGGTINVVVEGKLHAHKNNLKDTVEELADANITHKGVPVITRAEGGEITQQAEVEGNELIIHKALTKQMEELFEEGGEDAMIEAGKILARELVKNTKDSKSKILKNA